MVCKAGKVLFILPLSAQTLATALLRIFEIGRGGVKKNMKYGPLKAK